MLIVGCIGLALNIISATFLHGMFKIMNVQNVWTNITFLEHDHGEKDVNRCQPTENAAETRQAVLLPVLVSLHSMHISIPLYLV